MADTLTCPECGDTIRSREHLEAGHEVAELEPNEDGLTLYGNRDLFLCRNCKRPLGVGR
ncbi:hypothetical protein ACFQMM_02980 [Saliphagus sp. GCM10025308]